MATNLILGKQIEIPMTIRFLADFRACALSDEFPEQWRID
jgi:hypothetical protein